MAKSETTAGQSILNQTIKRCKKLQNEVANHEALLKLQRTRTFKADRLWQEAHNKPNVYPDLGELVEWLIERGDKAEAVLDRLPAGDIADGVAYALPDHMRGAKAKMREYAAILRAWQAQRGKG
jgi:hypothetical protein